MSLDESLHLTPAWCLRQTLDAMGDRGTRAFLRTVLAASAGGLRVEGAPLLAEVPDPAIFALTHHNAFEALLAPAALMAVRGGRTIRFLVDWMYLEMPLAGGLLRRGQPIAVYRKPARWRWRESVRRQGLAGPSPTERALAALAGGTSIGIYPEGRRNPDPWKLAPLRRGAAELALRSGAPLIPIGIRFPARERLGRLPRLGRMILSVGEPLTVAELRLRAAAAEPCDASTKQRIARHLAAVLSQALVVSLVHLARKSTCTQEPAMSVAPVTTARQSTRFDRPAALSSSLRAVRVSNAASRLAALSIVQQVYQQEKGWIADADSEFPESALSSPTSSWFLARLGNEAAGVVRLGYDPSFELPEGAGLEIDGGVDLARLTTSGRFVEVGRLMIAPRFRARTAVVLALMRAALGEVVQRGYTHLLTVVFEDDPHSPYGFHTRVLGFERIGTHRHGELACESRRIILTLDIARAFDRLRGRRAKFVQALTGGLEGELAGLAGPSPTR